MCTLVIFLLLFLTVLLGACSYGKLNLVVGSITLIIFLLIGDGFVPFYLLKYLQAYQEPQVIKWKTSNTIIILGTSAGASKAIRPDEIKPSFLSFSRITKGAELYRNCKINSSHCRILISGGDPLHNGKTEAAIFAGSLIKLGVNAADIELEPKSSNTFENAKFSSALLKQQPTDQLFLVTSGLALKRALLYFSYFNVYPTPVPADFITIPMAKFPLAYNLAINDFAVHEIMGIAQFSIYNFFGWNNKKKV